MSNVLSRRGPCQTLILGACHRGELLATLHQLDEEEDINKVLKYFSYEHFYVIYCKVRAAPRLSLAPLRSRTARTCACDAETRTNVPFKPSF